jgi:vacuolar-type H+-ATPase subunit I/STV1
MLDRKLRNSRFNMQTILGFLLGVVASLLWMFFAVFVGGTLGPRHTRMYAWFGALGFAVFGFIAAKQSRSSYALGMALAFGLAILLLAGYTLALYRSL